MLMKNNRIIQLYSVSELNLFSILNKIIVPRNSFELIYKIYFTYKSYCYNRRNAYFFKYKHVLLSCQTIRCSVVHVNPY